ncbi:MAG: stage II sporulation protein D [Candidatus Syntrophonatronum acetioxidans]|uniref:Stage II sporulation protein D n=1 Tax=Candidatus Syntrophonatronum acetioxidans TaxID=1795816 RepID=A0A424YFY0_9FIRM|nr:MAG: stage II sporulation protein D [Candidatus Syntrophonatronum acetioxidans]
MSRYAAYLILTLFTFVICLPALLVSLEGKGREPSPSSPPPPSLSSPPSPEINSQEKPELSLQVFNHLSGEVKDLPLEKYVVGVVAAEMPASFHKEALKAQAVIARTYALAQAGVTGGAGCDNHPAADICTEAAHCQAWESQEKSLAKWPSSQASPYWDKILSAVEETKSQIITCQGVPIDAVFHSTCGGNTDDSQEVWSASLPYLKGVSCSYCSHSPWSSRETSYTLGEFSRLISRYPQADQPSAYTSPDLAVLSRSSADRLQGLRLNNLSLTGHELRSLLDLPSTRVSWRVEGDNIIFSTRGYGHGVGLCQYGADGMAREGHTYEEILDYYYRDTEILTTHEYF